MCMLGCPDAYAAEPFVARLAAGNGRDRSPASTAVIALRGLAKLRVRRAALMALGGISIYV